MITNESVRARKKPFFFLSFSVAVVAICTGLFISLFPSHREYFPVGVSAKDGDDDDAGTKGEQDFFFNARKNIHTNAMDYSSMAAAALADRAMANARNTHAAMATGVPTYSWMSMGPNNVGGRTRAILIDNTDPTHQTIFAGGVSGGIWKSTNGGATWDNAAHAISYSLNDTLSNINVCCITQDASGAIYIGTGEGFSVSGYPQGEGFSTAILGGGMFKSTDDGATWNILPKTVPAPTNSANVPWAYINRLATRPDNPETLYAATNYGIYISRDGGATWRSAYAYNAVTKKLASLTSSASENALDLKISNDGSVIVAFINSYGYYCYPQTADSVFTQIKYTGAGHINGGATRIEFAISPTDPNRIYASVIVGGTFINKLSGIFMTTSAKTNGGYWYEIAQGGGAFNPYSLGGTGDQSTYDNTVGVPPANEAQLLCGGTVLWEWSGASISDTIGSWAQVSHYQGSLTNYDPLYIHPDEHAIVFDTKNPETVYVGCDGGIFKCTGWYVSPIHSVAEGAGPGAIANLVFGAMNRNYNVTQYYTICFSPMLDTSRVAMSVNNGTGIDSVTQHLGMGGGTQDNGSPYIDGNFFGHVYPNDGKDMSTGDGAGSVVSALDPNVAYFCADYGSLLRENNLGVLSLPTSAYTSAKGHNTGGNIDSVWQVASTNSAACFVFPVALYENPYDTLNHDSLLYTAPDTIKAGTIIYPVSATGNIAYPYKLTKTLNKGVSIKVPDRVVSKLAIGFTGSIGGIWVTGQAASSNVVVWIPIGGPLSKPTAYTDGADVHCLAWTPDGNTLFIGTEDGTFYRFSNMNSIIANSYKSGALWSGGYDTTNQVVSTNLTSNLGASNRDILSISVDPADSNNVLVTLGNYGDAAYVYYSNNALSAAPTFTKVQGNLPDMPVYGSILDIIDSTGHYISNSAMVATEHGIYTTSNVTSASAKWVKNSNGMANCLALAVKQQTASPYLCNNSGVIYVGSHGRGIWSAGNSFNINTAVQNVSAPEPASESLLIYPNPMTTRGNIEFELSSADDVTITIYDMQGREVKTISMGTQAPGTHLVTFESSGFREGTYFAALTGSNFRKVSKFVVVK